MAGDQHLNMSEYADRDALILAVADRMAGDLRAALKLQDRVAMAVAGGTTPGPIFDLLCQADLDWDRVVVMPSDERWVPEGHERSNAALIKGRLLVGRAAAASYQPLYVDGLSPEEGLPQLIEAVTPSLPLAVLMLGMGGDMHTASLFPGTPGLEAALAEDAPPLAVMRPTSQPEARISLTAPALKAAQNCHLVITGTDKRTALDTARGLTPAQAPVRAILNGTTIHWAE